MSDHLIIIRQSSHLRVVSDAEVLPALSADLRDLPRTDVHVDMRPFEADVEGGFWNSSEGFIIQKAQEIRAAANRASDPVVAFCGVAEVPHLIAMGAYVGDERRILVHDLYSEAWTWPEAEQTVALRPSTGLPTERVPVSGEVVVRIEVTYPIIDDDVNEVVPQDRFDDVILGVANPGRGVVRSAQDVEALRSAVRNALAAIRAHYPRLQRIHLICAAPASVCFAIGQELQIRNSVPVATYRYRPTDDGYSLREAIVLTPGEASAAARPLSQEERALAAEVRRGAWVEAVDDVIRYADTLKHDLRTDHGPPWFAPLRPADALAEADPFAALPPLSVLVNVRSSVNPDPLPGVEPPYLYPESSRAWQLTDRLLLAQRRGALYADGAVNRERLDRLVRLFLFHESVHKHHGLTKYTALEVGRFPNVLERLDYMADLYAALHELDYTARHLKKLTSEEALHDELVEILDDVLRSHWAFVEVDEAAPRWQVRHIRRFLNWYWRWVQVNRAQELGAGSLRVALRALANPPAIEVAGLEQQVGGRRVYARLDRLDPTTPLSLALVLENANYLDLPEQPNVNLKELMRAFANGDHEMIKSFFQTVFEKAQQAGGALPPH